MEPETNFQEEVQVEQKSVLHQVTPLSRYLALALFVILPFLAGWIGYTYAPEKDTNSSANWALTEPKYIQDKTDMDEPELKFNINSEGVFKLPDTLVKGAPLDCLPSISDREGGYYYAYEWQIKEMKQLLAGSQYGSFIYEGYVCDSKKNLNAPRLYFSGLEEISGSDRWTEYAGTEYFQIDNEDKYKLPNIFSSENSDDPDRFDYVSTNHDAPTIVNEPDCGCGWGATTTLTVDGLIFGKRGGFALHFGITYPSVRAIFVDK